MKKPKNRETKLVYIHKSRLVFTSVIDREKVKKIVREFDKDKYEPSIGYLFEWKLTITDGNHRALALIERGYDYVPFGLLTEEEYDWVKYSGRTFDLAVFIPEKPVLYPMYYVKYTFLNGETLKTTSFPLLQDPDEKTSLEVFRIAFGNLKKDKIFAEYYDKYGIAEKEIILDEEILTK